MTGRKRDKTICGLEFSGTDSQMEHLCDDADGRIRVNRFRNHFRAMILQCPWTGFGETPAEAVEDLLRVVREDIDTATPILARAGV